MDQLLEVKDLSVEYVMDEASVLAVDKVNFSVKKEEIFALVGESGCGKSTIAYTIDNLLLTGRVKKSGEVIFQGKNIINLSQNESTAFRGKRIGMIFQNPLDSLNPVYRTGEQIEEALMIDRIGKKQAYEIALRTMKELKIPDPAERLQSYPNELSGGMRQRAMIGMMICREPELLIADEPTTALDVTIEAQILQIIKKMQREHNTAVLLITHNFGAVAEIADRVGVMYAGRMIETGSVFQIFDEPKHPYTQLLMKALPTKRKTDGLLQTIKGTVPKIAERRDECTFADRCPYVMDVCRKKEPLRYRVADEHFCSCHLLNEEIK